MIERNNQQVHQNPVWLADLLQGIAEITDSENRLISSLELSSQKVNTGSLFVALPGLTADGRDYIESAIESGATAVLYESKDLKNPVSRSDLVPTLPVRGLKNCMGDIASRFFGNPSKAMNVIGITGTNGKTTTAFLLAQAHEFLGSRCGYSGTLGTGLLDSLVQSELTTADAIKLHGHLARFRRMGAEATCMEVSSHGLDQGRVNGVAFDVAVFTNLSQDHLDYHESMERYGLAKRKLFEFESLKVAVINTDDEYGREVEKFCLGRSGVEVIRFGMSSQDMEVVRLETTERGVEFDLRFQGQNWKISSSLLGKVNIPNILACIGALVGLGYSMPQICEAIPELSAPPGRMESFFQSEKHPLVVVDYAHTPDALERALVSLRPLCKKDLIVVFGCGGDRDQGKRPQMGAVAERLADRIIITDDNTRTEPATEIVAGIKAGIRSSVKVIHDRRDAITEAIRSAGAGDIVLVAGKGHESTQTQGDSIREFSDREVVPEIFEELS